VVALVIAGTPEVEFTVSVTVALPVPEELVALRVTVEVPTAEGMPEINPVLVFTESPLGSPVAAKLVGLLLAVI
jgi:hypothetical protein